MPVRSVSSKDRSANDARQNIAILQSVACSPATFDREFEFDISRPTFIDQYAVRPVTELPPTATESVLRPQHAERPGTDFNDNYRKLLLDPRMVTSSSAPRAFPG
jgi:hypothetical protein